MVGAGEHPFGHETGRDDRPVAVSVGEERVQRPHPLGEARLERDPLPRADDARDRVDPEPLPSEVDAARVDRRLNPRAEGF